jgi:hypothetical protein
MSQKKRGVALTQANWNYCESLGHFDSVEDAVNYLLNSIALGSPPVLPKNDPIRPSTTPVPPQNNPIESISTQIESPGNAFTDDEDWLSNPSFTEVD